MKITKIPMTTTGGAIEQLNKDVYGKDPVNKILTKVYNGTSSLQDRVKVLETTAQGLVVTKYIGPIYVSALNIPIAIGGQAAIDLLDALVFNNDHPNNKKEIGAVMVIPTNVVNDPNFTGANDVDYVIALTAYAGQIDLSGHVKMILKGDSPEFNFEISTTVNFATESYVVAPSLIVGLNPITPELLVITNPGKFGDGNSVTKAVEDLDDIKANKNTTYTKAEVSNFLAGKEPLITDSGWVQLTLTNGATGNIKIRKIGNQVCLMGIVNFVGSTQSDSGFTIPIGYRFDYSILGGLFEKVLFQKSSTIAYRIYFENGGSRVYPRESSGIGKDIVFFMNWMVA